MSIPVICPGCKAQFRVSDQFAGKTGPCPKCKAPIQVPKAEGTIKVHAPEEYASGGKDAKGRPVTKPIAREETRLSGTQITGLVSGMVAVMIAAWLAGRLVDNKPLLAAAGLLIVSVPLVVAGYPFLRDDEVEPHRGRSLWLRSTICGAIYALLWGIFALVPSWWMEEYWSWFYIAPPFLLAGAVTAFACLDLDVGSGFFHYCFYLAGTILLRYLINMPIHLSPGGSPL